MGVLGGGGGLGGGNSSSASGPAGGDLAGTFPDPTVAKIQTTPVSNGAPTAGDVLTFTAGQWVPAAPTGGAPTGAASGDLGGTYPSPTVAKIQTIPVSAAAPTAGQFLRENGGTWTPTTVTAATVGADPTGTATAAVAAHVIADPAHAASVVSVTANSLTGTRVQAQLDNAGTRIVALESAAIGANLLKWGFAARIVGEEFGPAGSAGESGATATTSGAGSGITANNALALNDYIIGVSRMTSGTGSTGTATLSWATNTFNFSPRDFGDILVFTILRVSALLVTNEISFGLGATFTAGATASAGLIARCIGNDNWVLDYRAAGISQASSASTTPLSTALIPRVVGILLTSSGASLYETGLPTVPSAQGLVRSPAYIAATLLATPSIASLTNVQLAATPPGQIGGFVRIRNSGATASANLDCAAFYQLAA